MQEADLSKVLTDDRQNQSGGTQPSHMLDQIEQQRKNAMQTSRWNLIL